MAESPDGRGVILFGGYSNENGIGNRLLELRAGADSWNTLNVTLENARAGHVVIPFFLCLSIQLLIACIFIIFLRKKNSKITHLLIYF